MYAAPAATNGGLMLSTIKRTDDLKTTPHKPFWPDVPFHKSNLSTAPPDTTLADDEDTDAEADTQVSLAELEPDSTDSPRLMLAKLMFKRFRLDLAGEVATEGDLFGFVSDDREILKFDALIWMFDLYPGKVVVPFKWVCDVLGLDPEVCRRVVARNMRRELKGVLKQIACIVDQRHAKHCEIKVSDYINLTGWQSN